MFRGYDAACGHMQPLVGDVEIAVVVGNDDQGLPVAAQIGQQPGVE
ncbi:hypothetical protein Q0601_22455 [Paracoccus onubensis]|nr:hypothetical protein [Paracoccus onubensis]MDP0929951.1 hypothetical protein [Paracoccus onubensis]